MEVEKDLVLCLRKLVLARVQRLKNFERGENCRVSYQGVGHGVGGGNPGVNGEKVYGRRERRGRITKGWQRGK